MDDPGRPHRGPARFLAPLALAATVLVVYLIVSGNERSGSGTTTGGPAPVHHHGGSAAGQHHGGSAAGQHQGGSAGRATATSTTGTTGTTGTGTGTSTSATTGTSTTGPDAKFYVVEPGDTMEVISEKTHVPLATIEALNPGVSSNAMTVGQRLRIRK